jgi:hypothetical protein
MVLQSPQSERQIATTLVVAMHGQHASRQGAQILAPIGAAHRNAQSAAAANAHDLAKCL